MNELKPIHVFLRCDLGIDLVCYHVIALLNQKVHDLAFLHLVQFLERKAQLLRPKQEESRVYFPVCRASSFFGMDVVFRVPRYIDTNSCI